MRTLNNKQKKSLTKVFENQTDHLFGRIPAVELDAIEAMNPHETFYQNAERFYADLYVDRICNGEKF